MKRNKIVCLDDDIVEFLSTTNASKLVNDLVRAHMDSKDVNQMTTQEIKKELEVIKIRKKADKEVKELG